MFLPGGYLQIFLEVVLCMNNQLKMRDPNRITEILLTIERIWQEDPDLRLGQLIVIGAKPKEPCPQIFYKEDEDLLKGLLEYEQRRKNIG